jgi:hypothetical protein
MAAFGSDSTDAAPERASVCRAGAWDCREDVLDRTRGKHHQGSEWRRSGGWALDGASSHFVSPVMLLLWVVVVIRIFLIPGSGYHTGC